MELKFQNLNQSLIGLSRVLLDEGKWRKTRGFSCLEIPEPVLIKIENPCDRYVNIPERKWNKVFGFVESLWIASGVNYMNLVGRYVRNMYAFSDDGQFMRAAYGPRVRAFSGLSEDYKIADPRHRNVFSGNPGTVDQLRFVVENLTRDINSRQALITIHDPVKDDFDSIGNLKVTKDTPCCRSLQFQVVDGKLDCTLYVRSNDIVWGYSAVNVFNFTFIQEYVAAMLNLPVGNYYHFVNNLHVYEDKIDLIESISQLNIEDYNFTEPYYYGGHIPFDKFDSAIFKLFEYEKYLAETGAELFDYKEFEYKMFQDWALVFFNYWNSAKIKYRFRNPYLNNLFDL